MREQYLVGTSNPSWKDGAAQSVSFIVTEDCNLRCKYCYITHKASNHKMDFQTAKKFIDYILSGKIPCGPAVILDFIGGEPFLEIALIDQICDYFKIRSYELGHPWFWNYRFSFSTNGLNLGLREVQEFFDKNKGKVSVGISVDGNKEKHDLQRIFPDGNGSYDEVVKNVPLYLKEFVPSTKVTFASEDLKYLKDSIVNLWNMGITQVSSNVVFENVWKEGDENILEEQLRQLADYILDHKVYDKYICTFFSDSIGGYLKPQLLEKPSCGAGKMLALGPNGNIYPCLRYKDYSLNHKEEWTLGNVDTGIEMERLRPFMVAANRYQSDEECLTCPVGQGCGQCQGFNYDEASTATNFQRAKYICKMHKARVRANEYYFAQLYERYGIERKRKPERRQMYILLSDNYMSYCCYQNVKTTENEEMSKETLAATLQYCYENFFEAVLVHPQNKVMEIDIPKMHEISVVHIVNAHYYEEATQKYANVLPVFEECSIDTPLKGTIKNCVLNIEEDAISTLAEYSVKLLQSARRVNVNIYNLSNRFPEQEYEKQLMKIEKELVKNPGKELDLITDRVFLKRFDNCRAGERNYMVSPKGRIYTCVGLYEEGLESEVGDIDSGIDQQKNAHLYKTEYHPICGTCDAYQCVNCIYRNKKATNEVNVSPSYQCKKGHIERKVTIQYQKESGCDEVMEDIRYTDPIANIPGVKTMYSFYKYS